MGQQEDYVFGVLLNKEMNYKSEQISEEVKQLVDKHFSHHLAKDDQLSEAQLHKLMNIAAYSPPCHVTRFIEKQAGKEGEKAKKRPWTRNDLHLKFKELVQKLENDAKSLYEEILEDTKEILGKEDYTPSPKEKEEIIYSLKSRLLREMTNQFSIYYLSRC